MLLLLEHPPVYTRGRRSKPEELPMGAEWYEAQGIEVRDTDRGGRVTYHGPGQLVAYPIVSPARLRRRRPRVRAAAGAEMIGALAEHGVERRTIEGLTGVWTDGRASPGSGGDPGGEARKIGSIGVHVSRGVTTHGLAVNVNNDLQPFEWVVPCGIEGVPDDLARAASSGPSRTSTPSPRTVAARFAEVYEREPGRRPSRAPSSGLRRR